jgi:hypothetical protein
VEKYGMETNDHSSLCAISMIEKKSYSKKIRGITYWATLACELNFWLCISYETGLFNRFTSKIANWTTEHIKQTPWYQNPKVHHRIHEIPPNCPYTEPGESTPHPSAKLPNVHFDSILPFTPWSSKWCFSFGL